MLDRVANLGKGQDLVQSKCIPSIASLGISLCVSLSVAALKVHGASHLTVPFPAVSSLRGDQVGVCLPEVGDALRAALELEPLLDRLPVLY